MSYHIYTTKGLVLSQRPILEADRIYNIMTRDLGLVNARALGVRKVSSKLASHIEPFTVSNVSFVRGKEYWRLTSAESIFCISSPAIFRPLALLEKLVQGESPHPELFDVVEDSLLSFKPDDEMSEINLVSNILFHLGYLKESDLALGKKELVMAINDGLENSHLV